MDRYESVLNYLYDALPMFQRIGPAAYKADLSNTIALCEALENPERKFKSIHVAGTNGKGSTSHMIAAIFQAAGYRTGLYTSPHLKEFTERIRINGEEVKRDFVVDFVDRTKPVIERLQPSFFEVTVGMAFDYFAQQRVDVAVVEVGMGGRLDSTNVITPDLSIITNISRDHMNLLGDTLAKVAFEKAGIIKPGVPVIISERQEAVEDVFIQRAAQMNADIVFAADLVQLHAHDGGFDVYQQGSLWLEGLIPGLKGNYQQRNLPGVLVAALVLRELGYEIPDKAVADGIREVTSLTGLKGRWQVLRQRPLTICDTGHNEAGIREAMTQLKALPHRKFHIVLGMTGDKDRSAILSLFPKEAAYYFCQPAIPRALDAAQLADEAEAAGLSGTLIPDVNEALAEAYANADPDDVIFVGGSTFVVAEIEGL